METIASFPGFFGKNTPTMKEIEPLFFNKFPKAWTDDADITIYFEQNSYVRLSIVPNDKYGIWLWHYSSITNDVNYLSLGDASQLSTYVDVGEDSLTLQGLYIDPHQAWLAVKDFSETGGKRSEKISWISENDIPEEMHWVVSSDCL